MRENEKEMKAELNFFSRCNAIGSVQFGGGGGGGGLLSFDFFITFLVAHRISLFPLILDYARCPGR